MARTATEPLTRMETEWKRWPQTQSTLAKWVEGFLERDPWTAKLAKRMESETSTRLADWVDHLILGADDSILETLSVIGYAPWADPDGGENQVWRHGNGLFPAVLVRDQGGPEVLELAIKVDSVAEFSRAHDLGLEPEGLPLGPLRRGRVGRLTVIERRGYLGFEPHSPEMARKGRIRPESTAGAMAALDLWRGRERAFAMDEQGFDATEALLERAIDLAGDVDLACALIFQAEREYWQGRNQAARVQKARQDRLGLGWANHDHHTFRSSRQFFPRLMRIFARLGFILRERFHAGHHAGWGAQVLEHPTTGVVIFADLDLAPEEAQTDFTSIALSELARPNTVGLWVALHGESILQAGMHHLEAQFLFDLLRDDLAREAGIETMKPFSDFPFLRQAFTAGETWRVASDRAGHCLTKGWIDEAQHKHFIENGAIGSHLENLQRQEGFKGFNQQAVSAILIETDPRLRMADVGH